MFNYRDYQLKAIEDAITVLTSKKATKSVVVQPTAAGKSHLIQAIASRLDGNILVVQPSKELLLQNYNKLIDSGGKAEIYSASFASKKIGRITYATDGSLNIAAFKDKNIKYVLIDECHLKTQNGSKLISFLKGISIKNILGLTASPVYLKAGADGAQLKMVNRVRGKLFTDICHVTQISELVEKGYWSRIIYDVKNISNKLDFNTNGSDYTKESLVANYENNDIALKIIKCIKENPDRKSILIFVPTIKEAIDLQKKTEGSEVVYSGMDSKKRDTVIKAFKELHLRIVINVNILAVGFDHPQLDYEIGARPTASIGMWYQQVGRGVRIHDLKKDFLYSDLAGNVERFGKLEEITFQNIEGYGWGMFTGERLLTGVPFWESEIITISKLKQKNVDNEDIIPTTFTGDMSLKIWFGKFEGELCENIVKNNSQYISWLLGNKDWDWTSKKMSELKGVLLHFMRKYYNKHF